MPEVILFLAPPFVASVVVLGLMGYIGVHVLKREIIFIDIALAQIAAVGAIFAHAFLGAREGGLAAHLCAFGFTAAASLFFALAGRRITQLSSEAIIGVTYAIAAASGLFLLALAAGGDIHVEHMLTGSILWARWSDIAAIGGLFAAIGLLHLVFRRRFMALSEEYGAGRRGAGGGVWWDFLFYLTIGLAVTFSVRLAGVLVIFSFLVIPASFSALFARSWGARLLIGWAMGVPAVILGLLVSYYLDFPAGPAVVTVLGAALVTAAVARAVR